jgi:hypothetical protein
LTPCPWSIEIRDEAPGRGLVSVRPVNRPEARVQALEIGNHRVALADLGPSAAVDVEAQNARDLPSGRSCVDAPVDRPADASGGVLDQAHADRLPSVVGQEGQVKVAGFGVACCGRLVPGADEFGALLERKVA